jgi:DNA-binding CsgD family transcriptional regulator
LSEYLAIDDTRGNEAMRNQKKFYLYNVKTDINTPLSPREVECIVHILRGKTSKQIARMLKLSHRTVEFYVGRLKQKLYCHTKSELIEKILSGRLIGQGEPESTELQMMAVQEHHKLDSIINKLDEYKKEEVIKK